MTPTTPETPASPPVPETPPAPAVEPLSATSFTLPEGQTLDQPSMDAFLSIMNDTALDPAARGQELLNLYASLTTKSSEAGSQAWKDQQQAWQQEVIADPELGGANLEKTIAGIGSIMDRFGNDEVRAALDQTGAGNHPAVVRFLSTLASQLREPGPTPQGSPASAAATTLEKRLFPNMN